MPVALTISVRSLATWAMTSVAAAVVAAAAVVVAAACEGKVCGDSFRQKLPGGHSRPWLTPCAFACSSAARVSARLLQLLCSHAA